MFVGYKTVRKIVHLKENTSLYVELFEDTETIEEIVVSSKKKDCNVRDAQMSIQKLQSKDIKVIPVLMGEVDVIKVYAYPR